jgi:Na+/H+ antiporter NhaD/arsenite permease-like protein
VLGIVAAAAPLGSALSLLDVLPFVGILLSIAIFPLLAPHFWHRHYPKVAAAWALAFAVPFLLRFSGAAVHEILHVALAEYVPFVVLLWGLYTVAGGIELRGTLPGSARTNLLLLLAGTALASLIGTTGASMLLIRPLLRANAGRRQRAHVVVFFVFLVSNIGGSLTPLGDPPLFLGFLQGVPFFWTLQLLPETVLLVAFLSAAFYGIDARAWRRERAPAAAGPPARLGVAGAPNLALLAGIVLAVWASGVWDPGTVAVLGVELSGASLARDAVIVGIGLASLGITPAGLRERIGFGWAPMKEVAILFAAIFVTIVPAMAMLRAGEGGPLGGMVSALASPDQFYWATGLLSSVLDNAPTYLTMFHTLLGRFSPGLPPDEAVLVLLTERAAYLEAISAGAVFMGALTYIGNAPNFMVKAIAEDSGVAMPTFLGYVARWSVPFLLPAFALVAWLMI